MVSENTDLEVDMLGYILLLGKYLSSSMLH